MTCVRGTDEAVHVGVRSDGDDRAVPGGERLRLGQCRIEREDAAAPEDEIGGLDLRDLRAGANHGHRQHEDGNQSLRTMRLPEETFCSVGCPNTREKLPPKTRAWAAGAMPRSSRIAR